MIYAQPGFGKTTLISMPGTRTLILRPPIDHTQGVPIESTAEEWIIHSHSELLEAKMYFLQGSGGEDYDWVWFDSISGWQEIGLRDVFEEVCHKYPHRRGGPIDKGEYFQNSQRISAFVADLVGADNVNFGVTAWPFKGENDEGDRMQMPWIQVTGMPIKISGYMTIVGYLDIRTRKSDDSSGKWKKGDKYRVLLTDPNPDYIAKDQTNQIGTMVNPSMDKINSAIERARNARQSAQKPVARRRRPTAAGSRA